MTESLDYKYLSSAYVIFGEGARSRMRAGGGAVARNGKYRQAARRGSLTRFGQATLSNKRENEREPERLLQHRS